MVSPLAEMISRRRVSMDDKRARNGSVKHEKTCLVCGKNFETFYPNKTYCSYECSNKAHLDGMKAAKEAGRPTFTAQDRTCGVCGKTFKSHHYRRRYCSASCSKSAISAQHAEKKRQRTNKPVVLHEN